MNEPTKRHTDAKSSEPTQGELFPMVLGLMGLAGLVAVAARLLAPAGLWPWNLSPIGALALYGGARLRSWRAFVLPVAVMVVTDFILWAVLGNRPFNPWVYASFGIYVLLGRLLTRTTSPIWIGGACVAGAIQFFLLTNLSVWLASNAELPEGTAVVWEEGKGKYPSPTYARNVAGLLACYAAALPFTNKDVLRLAPPLGFFGNWLLGDFLFSGLLFGAHAWLSPRYVRRVSRLARAG
jgi:hypothetical protein